MNRAVWIFAVAVLALAPRAWAEHPVYTDPKDAGPDFQIQGEYQSEDGGSSKYGAQVVALGDGAFDVIVLKGGLPGAGWDGKTRLRGTAHRNGDKAEILFEQKPSGSIADGAMEATIPGQRLKLKRVERQISQDTRHPRDDANILFDGYDTDKWENGKIDDRHLLVDGARTKRKYQNFLLHVEFLLPFKPFARGQERGNSGVYLQDRYEVQILDTFGHGAEIDGCGSMYRQHAPLVDMCYPPLQWQSYDIDFHAAQFDASGKKVKNAVVTVKQNGVVVQDHYELTGKTGNGKPEGPEPGPIYLQAHNNPVFFRNVWIVEE